MGRPFLEPSDARKLAKILTTYARTPAPGPSESAAASDAVIAAAVELCSREILADRIMAACADDPDPESMPKLEQGPLFDLPVVGS